MHYSAWVKVFFLKEDGTFLKVGWFYNTRKDLAFQYYRNLIIDFLIGDFLNCGNIRISLEESFGSRLYEVYRVANPNKAHVSATVAHRAVAVTFP